MVSRPSFFADDALAYAENYKDLISKNFQQISQLKEEFEKKFWDGIQNDHFFYVKLRAFEHALQYKETGRSPEGMVILGDASQDQQPGLAADEGKVQELDAEAKAKARQFSDAVKNMQEELKKAQARQVTLKGEIIQREQVIKRLQRQMTNTQGTYALLISALIIGVALAFWL